MFVRLISTVLLFTFLAVPGATNAQTYIHSPSDAEGLEDADFWLVTLGDSFASGEGNPTNVAGVGVPVNAWKWLDDEKCHRSNHSWPYQVAKYYENSDEYPRDVFHSFLACSGASVQTGLLNDYRPNWLGLSASSVTAQLKQLERQISRAGRTPDVVLLSAGGNDIGFGDVVKDCLWGSCPGGLASEEEVEDRLSNLRARYDAVDRHLNDMGMTDGTVYQFQYPSPLWGKKRKIWGAWGPEKVLANCWQASGRGAWRWAENNVVEPLQSAVENSVTRNDWTLVDGHLDDFVKHSYCPRNGLPGADSWWVGIISTVVRQWGVGAFHPNRRGHDRIAEVVRSAIEEDVPNEWEFEEPEPEIPDEASRWVGTYDGRSDGRDARLVISRDEESGSLDIKFRDLDRGTKLEGTATPWIGSNEEEETHIIKDLTLRNDGCTSWASDDTECVSKHIERLYLHGWSEGHISGYSTWDDKNFGVAFSTEDVASSLGDGGALDRSTWVSAWTGVYVGYHDGHDARLRIERADSKLNISLIDEDRSKTFTGSVSISEQSQSPPRHVLKNLRLTATDGLEKDIGRLFLHTWDTNYVTGFSRWGNSTYGSYFVRE